MNKAFPSILWLLCWATLLSSCSATSFLKDGELLYTGAEVNVLDTALTRKQRKIVQQRLEELARPKPNSAFLGMRPKLWIYYVAGEPTKPKGIRYWLRNKVGEAPVLFQQVDRDYNQQVLQSNAENKGFFNANVQGDSVTIGSKKVKMVYDAELKNRYSIDSIAFPKPTTPLEKLIGESSSQSLLKSGKPFDLEVIKQERIRIDAFLKEKGYYFFSPDHLLVEVDSTVAKSKVNLFVKVKENSSPAALTPYTINDVFIYPSFSVARDTIGIQEKDVYYYDQYIVIDKNNRFKPSIFDRSLYFKRGDLYNRTDHNLSLNRLVNLGVFKFVKNQFLVLEDSLSNTMDAFYYLTPLPKKSLRAEIIGKTNSANYTGTELNIKWSNRNTFRGAELWQISAFGGLEMQFSGNNQEFNIYRFGLESSLTWPRIIAPFRFHSASGFLPKTRATLGYEYQLRTQLYSLQSFKASWEYLWKENIRKEHSLKIIDITYVNPTHVTDLYREQIAANPALAKVVEKQLIIGPTYTYTYTNTMQTERKHSYYLRGHLDLAGNISGLISGADLRNGNEKTILGVPFSQYAKIEAEVRYFWRWDKNTTWANRFLAGAGYPYGNSTELPYMKQFFNGGTNSLRAFRARSIGPGSYDGSIENAAFYPDQSGDIKLELNTELRRKLFWVVEGAAFLDAGNIWLRKENPLKPGAEFNADFYKEIAVGAGLGLRFDFSFLILRTDLALPLRKPWLEENKRWVIDQIQFGSSHWKRDNLIFNLAIGYPF